MKITVQTVIKGLRYLRHYGFREFLIRLQEKREAEQVPYGPWYEKHKATAEALAAQAKKSARWKDAPLISIVTPLYCTDERFLREMIASVQAQSYPNWQLCLADGSPADGGGAGRGDAAGAVCATERVARELAAGDGRISYVHLEQNLGIADNTNAAIEMARGDWIAFLDHDDLLAPDALYEAVKLMYEGGGTYDMIYTDEDKVDMEGNEHFDPHLKPGFNPDLLRSNNYITHFLLVKKSLLAKAGKIRKDFDGAQDYDFILRCSECAAAIGHVPRILYHWRCHKESTAQNPFAKEYAVEAGRRAIAEHLARVGAAGEVTPTKDMGFYTVRYLCEGEPLVSVIIPSKDETESLAACIRAVETCGYRNFEIIVVENNSCEATFDYYRSIAPKERIIDGADCMEGTLAGGQRLLVAVWKEGFNYSKLNNFGVRFASGDYLLLLNNDVRMESAGWMAELLGTCMRSEVGIVGTKLYYPDDTVQHAGVVVGIGGNARGIAQNMFIGLPRGRSGYLHKASLAMDYSAVTAACMMVKRSVYGQAGGFSEELAVAFNDVDFCLKVRRLGFLVVYQPRAWGYHYESKSRGSEDSPEKAARFQREIEYMRNHWMDILKNGDPYYNPNFSSTYPNYSLRDTERAGRR